MRRIDPAGFTKISALGIEEQRVKAILDFVDPPEMWRGLGHGYRVVLDIVVRDIEDAVRVPLGALFRRGDQWAVFTVGAVAETPISLGPRSLRHAVVEGGLETGIRIILHPSDRVAAGVQLVERGNE